MSTDGLNDEMIPQWITLKMDSSVLPPSFYSPVLSLICPNTDFFLQGSYDVVKFLDLIFQDNDDFNLEFTSSKMDIANSSIIETSRIKLRPGRSKCEWLIGQDYSGADIKGHVFDLDLKITAQFSDNQLALVKLEWDQDTLLEQLKELNPPEEDAAEGVLLSSELLGGEDLEPTLSSTEYQEHQNRSETPDKSTYTIDNPLTPQDLSPNPQSFETFQEAKVDEQENTVQDQTVFSENANQNPVNNETNTEIPDSTLQNQDITDETIESNHEEAPEELGNQSVLDPEPEVLNVEQEEITSHNNTEPISDESTNQAVTLLTQDSDPVEIHEKDVVISDQTENLIDLSTESEIVEIPQEAKVDVQEPLINEEDAIPKFIDESLLNDEVVAENTQTAPETQNNVEEIAQTNEEEEPKEQPDIIDSKFETEALLSDQEQADLLNNETESNEPELIPEPEASIYAQEQIDLPKDDALSIEQNDTLPTDNADAIQDTEESQTTQVNELQPQPETTETAQVDDDHEKSEPIKANGAQEHSTNQSETILQNDTEEKQIENPTDSDINSSTLLQEQPQKLESSSTNPSKVSQNKTETPKKLINIRSPPTQTTSIKSVLSPPQVRAKPTITKSPIQTRSRDTTRSSGSNVASNLTKSSIKSPPTRTQVLSPKSNIRSPPTRTQIISPRPNSSHSNKSNPSNSASPGRPIADWAKETKSPKSSINNNQFASTFSVGKPGSNPDAFKGTQRAQVPLRVTPTPPKPTPSRGLLSTQINFQPKPSELERKPVKNVQDKLVESWAKSLRPSPNNDEVKN